MLSKRKNVFIIISIVLFVSVTYIIHLNKKPEQGFISFLEMFDKLDKDNAWFLQISSAKTGNLTDLENQQEINSYINLLKNTKDSAIYLGIASFEDFNNNSKDFELHILINRGEYKLCFLDKFLYYIHNNQIEAYGFEFDGIAEKYNLNK